MESWDIFLLTGKQLPRHADLGHGVRHLAPGPGADAGLLQHVGQVARGGGLHRALLVVRGLPRRGLQDRAQPRLPQPRRRPDGHWLVVPRRKRDGGGPAVRRGGGGRGEVAGGAGAAACGGSGGAGDGVGRVWRTGDVCFAFSGALAYLRGDGMDRPAPEGYRLAPCWLAWAKVVAGCIWHDVRIRMYIDIWRFWVLFPG